MRIYLICEAHFGQSLRRLDLSSPIWVLQSRANNVVVSEILRCTPAKITSFRRQCLEELIREIDQQYPGWRELDVHGLCAEDAEEALAKYGPGKFIPDGYTFKFQRQSRK